MRHGQLRTFAWLALLAFSLALAGCSSGKPDRVSSKKMFNSKGESLAGFAGTGSPYLKSSGPIPKGGGRYHVGKPYQVAGKWYHPKEQPGYDRQGAASWYGEDFHRRKTSNGEYFDMNMLSAAHPTLPLPSYAKVTNLNNGKSVIVRINDRGPFVGTRIIDLSKKAADTLDFRHSGKAGVRVQWIGNAPLNDKGSHLAMMNRKLREGASVRNLVAAAEGGSEPTQQVAKASRKTRMQQPLYQQASVAEEEFEQGQSYMIRVGTFLNPENAQAAYEQVSALGPAQQLEVGNAYRLQLGPYASRTEAEEALAALMSEGYPDAILLKTKLEMAASRP